MLLCGAAGHTTQSFAEGSRPLHPPVNLLSAEANLRQSCQPVSETMMQTLMYSNSVAMGLPCL
jgi:hypothetical protein